MKTKSFNELRKQMTPERRAKNKARAQLALLYLNLAELQESLGVTPDNMGQDIDILSVLSDIENQEDHQISTLSRYIQALGGSLKIVANFPDKEVTLAHFE
jgi:hypothetical protein